MNDLLDLLADLDRRAAERGTTLSKVCDEAGLAASTVRRWRAGIGIPTGSTYRFLCQFMNGEVGRKPGRKSAA